MAPRKNTISDQRREELLRKYEGLDDRMWRYEHLYRIADQEGNDVQVELNWCQRELARTMWFREIILKGRQVWVTTFLQLYALDMAFFNSNFRAGIIAQTKELAEEIFEDKLLYMYNSMPEDLKKINPIVSINKQEMKFANGSKIRVSTSFVSGTYHFIHISEYAAMAQESEEKAQKVKRSVQAVSPRCIVVYECTSRGPDGSFHEMWNDAVETEAEIKAGKRKRSPLDFRPRFFPAWKHPRNRDYNAITLTDGEQDYFDRLEDELKKPMPDEYRYWYVRKKEELGHAMPQEYPNTPEEAFEVILEHQIFGTQVRRLEDEGRAMNLPHIRGEPVHVAMDIGRSDACAMMFYQYHVAWTNVIRSYENKNLDVTFYVEILQSFREQYGYAYGTIYLPHDGKAKHYTSLAGSAEDVFRRNGFDVYVISRPGKKAASIEPARRAFSRCRFDRVDCADMLVSLKHYSWEEDPKTRKPTDIPKHDRHCHYADAFQTFALADNDGAELRKIMEEMERSRPGSGYRRRENREPEWEPEYEDVPL